MRVCLISPGHVATNPRLLKEADTLSAAGHVVTVIAADYSIWAREADKAFASRPWQAISPVRFGPLAPRALRIVQLISHRLARVLFRLGARHASVLTAACHQVGPTLLSAACHVEADLYIAHYIAALPAAANAADKHHAHYAFDAEDFHAGEFESNEQSSLLPRVIRAVEQRWLPGCAYVTAGSPGIADAYAETYSIPLPVVVLNVFPTAQAPKAATPKGSAEPRPSVYWYSQTIGPNRGLETAVRAIALAKTRPHLFLRGTPAREFAERLTALAAQEGVANRLHLLPSAAPEEMVRLASEFDIGLVAETGHTANRRIALTNKLFTYLLAGIPVAASDIPAHRAIADGVGVALFRADNAVSLAKTIDALIEEPNTLASARAIAFRLGQQRFNWDIEQQTLLDQVHALRLEPQS